jgi:acyl-CoA synthetase (NDP forming)
MEALDSYCYDGDVFPVNTSETAINGRKVYSSLNELPATPDLAVIAVRASVGPSLVEQCGHLGIRFAVVLSAGFGEAGADGKQLEKQLAANAQRTGVTLLGPNTVGFLDVSTGVAAGFGLGREGLSRPRPGQLAIISQSGGMGLALLNRAAVNGLGVSLFAATGNEADLTLLDVLAHAIERRDTRVVTVYAERLTDLRRLVELGRRAFELNKTVIIAKIGRTEAGRRAVLSHTGAMAGADASYDAAFRKAGIIRVDDVGDVIDIALFVSHDKVVKGRRVAVVTQSGGGGAWLADSLERNGLTLPAPGSGLQDALRAMIPHFGATGNPIDITASGISFDTFRDVISTVSASETYDAIVVVLPLVDAPLGDLHRLAQATQGPLLGFTHWLPTPEVKAKFGELGIPYVISPESAARVLAAAARLGERQAQETVPTSAGADESAPALRFVPTDDAGAFRVLRSAGFCVPDWNVASNERAAAQAAQAIGFPVALKRCSEGVVHKSDADGVKLDLQNADDVYRAFQELVPVACPEGCDWRVLVQRMAPAGLEVIIGSHYDESAGPLVMVGSGGVYAEIFADVTYRLAPVSTAEAREMLGELRLMPLLRGFRGNPPRDVDALCKIVRKVSVCAVQWADAIDDIDLNPVVALENGKGAIAVDATLIGKPAARPTEM